MKDNTMIIVTGGAGFIGSNIVKGLNKIGKNNILVVDDLTDGTKFKNIADCKILDYIDKDDFIYLLEADELILEKKIEAVFHQGACSDTMEWNGNYMMRNNFEYSKKLFQFCLRDFIPFIYASSAAVYGKGTNFAPIPENEKPLNIYGYSKLLFDQYVRRFLPNPKSQIVGLRYFNVYGPHEQHKGKMASVAFHLNNQLLQDNKIKLFGEYDGYKPGEQLRDFVYIDDIVAVNLWFYQNQNNSGIFNVGTGHAETFNTVAHEIIKFYQHGELEYIPFPNNLRNFYQSYTEADISELRKIGYDQKFKTVAEGVKLYLEWLKNNFSN